MLKKQFLINTSLSVFEFLHIETDLANIEKKKLNW